MSYDASGNMTKKGSATYTWTQGDKLSAVSNGKKLRYYYDHTGARVKKVADGTTTEYRMAGSLIASEKTGSETIWYHYDSSANLVALTAVSTRYYCLRNGQNDIIALIDSSGTKVVEYTYDSWGNTISITGSLASTIGQKNPFRYRGYYYDTETGMCYLQSRYYDPEIRRFISADTTKNIMTIPEKITQYNLFMYCFNNPVSFIDDDGKWPKWVTKVVVGTLAIAAGITATVLTGGTSLLVPALVASLKVAGTGVVIGASVATVTHIATQKTLKGVEEAVIDGAATGIWLVDLLQVECRLVVLY